MNQLFIKSLILLTLLFLSSLVIADGFGFEIVQVIYDKRTYFIIIDSKGDSVSTQMMYYSKYGKFKQSVFERIQQSFDLSKELKVYKNLEVIDLSKFIGYNSYENKLYILNNQVIHIPSNFRDSMMVENVLIGNFENFIYPSNLKTEDNEWITNNEILSYWDFDDGEVYCKMSLFSIKDTITTSDLNYYKSKLNLLNRSSSDCDFLEFINELYKKKILVIGFCSD